MADDSLPGWMREFYSDPRLAPYLAAAKGDPGLVMHLYRWNEDVSAAFLRPLGRFEVGLRNALHHRLRMRYGRSDWWAVAPLAENGLWLVDQARKKCPRRGSNPVTADDIVAQLSFGFWVALISSSYDRYLWVPALHRAFPNYSGRRSTLHDNLQAMRLLRNRIGHHEPIYHRHLAADHAKIYRLLGYLSLAAVAEVRRCDQVPMVLAQRPVVS